MRERNALVALEKYCSSIAARELKSRRRETRNETKVPIDGKNEIYWLSIGRDNAVAENVSMPIKTRNIGVAEL